MKYVFGTLCLALMGYEAVALMTSADGDTISEIIWGLSNRPLVPFAFGMLMGHFFWQKKGDG